jgi:hypothetical protein
LQQFAPPKSFEKMAAGTNPKAAALTIPTPFFSARKCLLFDPVTT